MGRLADALSRPSSYRAKKTDWWDHFNFSLSICVCDEDVDEIERWVASCEMAIPAAWDEDIAELIEKKREECAGENVRTILRERFDF